MSAEQKHTAGPWVPGLPPGHYYPGMAADYEVYFSPAGAIWHRRRATGGQ